MLDNLGCEESGFSNLMIGFAEPLPLQIVRRCGERISQFKKVIFKYVQQVEDANKILWNVMFEKVVNHVTSYEQGR